MSDRNSQDVQRRIIEIAAEKGGVSPAGVSPATHFVNDLKYDSLSVVEFTMTVEDEFEISIPDEDVQTLQTVGDAIAYVQRRAKDVPAKA
jgi:acyl carrier protein